MTHDITDNRRGVLRSLGASIGGVAAVLLIIILVTELTRPAAARMAAGTVVVTSTSDSGPGSLREALVQTVEGDTIVFSLPASSTIVLTSGELTVTRSVHVNGATAANLTVSGNNVSRAFSVTAPSTFSAFSIAHGSAFLGGGIAGGTDVTLTNMTLISNTAAQDGGGAFVSGTLVLNGGLFAGNTSGTNGAGGGGGGGLYVRGSMNLTGTQFLRNTATGFGGGVYSVGDAKFTNGLFSENVVNQVGSDGGGGGLFVLANVELSNTVFFSNAAKSVPNNGNTVARGGGLYVMGSSTLYGGSFERNLASNAGGGLYTANTLVLSGTKFLNNSAILSQGGGAASIGAASVLKGVFWENSGGRGGGIYTGPAGVTGTMFIRNSSYDDGGGAYFSGDATVQDSVFEQNTGDSGGGLMSEERLTIIHSTFVQNHAGHGGGISHLGLYKNNTGTITTSRFYDNAARYTGGAIVTRYALYLADSEFVGNSSEMGGGAVMIAYGVGAQPVQVQNVLFARNADAAGVGSAIASTFAQPRLFILHTTIVTPTLSSAAAIEFDGGGTAGITNTLIAGYSVGISVSSGSGYEDYNVFSGVITPTVGAVTSGPHHPTGDPAFLNPAADNYHLWQGSAAIDSGVDAGVAVDIDGQPRPRGAGFDIGCDEASAAFYDIYLPLVAR